MQIYLDSASLDEVRQAADLGVLDGVTTNPTLIAKEGVDYARRLGEICRVVKGPVSAEVIATDFEGMVREGKERAMIAPNIVVKLPSTLPGLKACKALSDEGPKRRGGPSQDWATFLRNHDSAIAAVDMFTTPTLLFGRLYAFVVLLHHRRRILHVEVTDHPNALWLAQEIAAAFEHEPAPGFLVRDNDGAFGMTFRKRLRAMGIRDHPTSPHSPWQNGHAERLIGSIRRECLDHVIVVNAAHLRRLLQEYAEYYNNDRTHLALDKDAPNPRPIEREGAIRSRPVLGGLHRRYARSRRK